MTQAKPMSSSRRRFLGQAAVAGAAAAGLSSLAPAAHAAAPSAPREEALSPEGPWVRVKSLKVRQLLERARRISLSDPRRGAVEEFLAGPSARELDATHGPLMTVHFEVYDFLNRLS
jgi:hypothetical protein